MDLQGKKGPEGKGRRSTRTWRLSQSSKLDRTPACTAATPQLGPTLHSTCRLMPTGRALLQTAFRPPTDCRPKRLERLCHSDFEARSLQVGQMQLDLLVTLVKSSQEEILHLVLLPYGGAYAVLLRTHDNADIAVDDVPTPEAIEPRLQGCQRLQV